MVRRLPQTGEVYEYVGEPVGGAPGAVNTGVLVTVREVVPAGEPGAHDDSADAVVLEWTEPALGSEDDGQPVIIDAPRVWSVAVDEFSDLFKKVSG